MLLDLIDPNHPGDRGLMHQTWIGVTESGGKGSSQCLNWNFRVSFDLQRLTRSVV